MNRKLLAQYGLKWNPFSPEVPVEGLTVSPALDSFCRRVDNLAREGGFALAAGDPGSGKSAALRVLVDRLGKLQEVRVGILTRPQSRLHDFFREMGDLFGVELSPHNRWAGTKVLRERWQAHVETALYRAVLVVDEAQEMPATVLNELRLLASVELDSRLLLTVVLAGDSRLTAKLRGEDLLPLGSRIRVRLNLEPQSSAALATCLRQALDVAGNAGLMTEELVSTLTDHAAGNYRVLMTLASDLLAAAAERNLSRLDEKLFLEVFAPPKPAAVEREMAAAGSRRGRR
jgi:type II secretory pathway predicted ATPase ExeA